MTALARHARHLLLFTVATLALAAPATAFAGPSAQLSAVDALSSDVAIDGSTESTSAGTTSTASDSPSVDTYSGGGGESVPPPVDCAAPVTESTSDSSSSIGTDSSSGAGTDTSSSCAPVVQCSASDSDGMDQHGKPCVECSEADTDGSDASGKPCVPATTTTAPVTEQPCAGATGSGTGTGASGGGAPLGLELGAAPGKQPAQPTACGGGGGVVGEPEELSVVDSPAPVEGGGTDEPAPAEALGGGGPELPFTGMPLSWAIGGGFGLILLGMAFWGRGRFGNQT